MDNSVVPVRKIKPKTQRRVPRDSYQFYPSVTLLFFIVFEREVKAFSKKKKKEREVKETRRN